MSVPQRIVPIRNCRKNADHGAPRPTSYRCACQLPTHQGTCARILLCVGSVHALESSCALASPAPHALDSSCAAADAQEESSATHQGTCARILLCVGSAERMYLDVLEVDKHSTCARILLCVGSGGCSACTPLLWCMRGVCMTPVVSMLCGRSCSVRLFPLARVDARTRISSRSPAAARPRVASLAFPNTSCCSTEAMAAA